VGIIGNLGALVGAAFCMARLLNRPSYHADSAGEPFAHDSAILQPNIAFNI
jgi:hypothetical protein